jgi:hypothetical protein
MPEKKTLGESLLIARRFAIKRAAFPAPRDVKFSICASPFGDIDGH